MRTFPVKSMISCLLIFFGFVKFSIDECLRYKVESDSKGKVILVTGANSGLGYHTSLFLAKEGALVTMACRSKDKCEEAKRSIISIAPHAQVEARVLDLSSFQSIRQFSAEFKAAHSHLDVLVNNAGIMAIPAREITKDGLESQIGTNHFGHFLLTSLLFPIIAKKGRIVNQSNSAHEFAASNFVFNDLLSEKSYEAWSAYGNSKAANLLFTYELNQRLAQAGNTREIISVAVHPGYPATSLQAGKLPLWEYMSALFALKGEHRALSQNEGNILI